MIFKILADGFLAAVACIGFGAVSNPPRHALFISGIFAAFGHAFRFSLMQFNCDIVSATLFGAFLIGVMSLAAAKILNYAAEVFSFPALLPMVPGLIGYKALLAIEKFLRESDGAMSQIYMDEFLENCIRASSILLAMVLGACLSVFVDSFFVGAGRCGESQGLRAQNRKR